MLPRSPRACNCQFRILYKLTDQTRMIMIFCRTLNFPPVLTIFTTSGNAIHLPATLSQNPYTYMYICIFVWPITIIYIYPHASISRRGSISHRIFRWPESYVKKHPECDATAGTPYRGLFAIIRTRQLNQLIEENKEM